ncbi:hypothetical protein DYB38_011758 [Aphanomyces astaci]|uniref:Uncharacterized protein n=1 Tax=Aphanomyces astaci TaxID=112090 RepID=A0A397E5A8_APHAT|nr:hypothetical protein DYB38_011758 [Aphanomyces astaci]
MVAVATANSKITFDSDGEAQAEVVAPSVGFGDDPIINKQKKALFIESDESDHDESELGANSSVAFRPEFAGVEGKKLFDLQKRFGGDDRFRLDERFMDEFAGDDGDVAAAPPISVDPVDDSIQAWKVIDDRDVAAQQAEEKAEQIRALEMLQDLFPDMKIDKGKWTMGQVPDQKQLGYGELVWTDAPLPPVSTERYFTATSDLSTMFSRVRANSEDGDEMEPALDGLAISAAQTSSVFSFASMFETPVEKEAQDWSISSTAAADDDHTKGDDEDEAHRAWHFAKSTRDDGSTDGENEQEEEEQGPATTAVIKRPVAEVLAFGRTFFKPEQWTPEHEAAWVSMRKIYTVDFRRKHKQALKNRKSAKKAMSHHPKK